MKSLEYDINKLYTNYRNMTRHKNRKSNIEWCLKTMPLWPKGTEEKMKQKISILLFVRARKINVAIRFKISN